MRVLLTAITCEKGDLATNLGRHLGALTEARASDCDLAVLPELSLTGSVDAHRGIAIGDAAVASLVEATAATGVDVLFGLAERTDDAGFITQVHASNGRIAGVQRKRHLGDGEESFAVGADTSTFACRGVRFGVVICAETSVPGLWDASAANDEHVLFVCSAPGLHGRRTDTASWREGLAWWESAGLADARRHAARLRRWVALATQAGATLDEDFPGIAALVAPDGEVVARLPDWQPGTLLVEV